MPTAEQVQKRVNKLAEIVKDERDHLRRDLDSAIHGLAEQIESLEGTVSDLQESVDYLMSEIAHGPARQVRKPQKAAKRSKTRK